MQELNEWMGEREHDTPPRSPLGAAITYAQNQWKAATLFLDDPHLPVDNNASETALRVVALGRKNFLMQDHPGSKLDALLPWNWHPPPAITPSDGPIAAPG